VAGCRMQLQCFLQRYLPRFHRSEQHDLARHYYAAFLARILLTVV
jgi:hypothetical protein